MAHPLRNDISMSATQELFRICAPLNHAALPALQTIEMASTLQIPAFHVVGLPSQEISEARERVRAAIDSSGFDFPKRRVVLNLSPASIRKQGTDLDLAMALAVLASDAPDSVRGMIVASGELSLDGKIREAGQTLRALYAAWAAGADFLLLPKASEIPAAEALTLIALNREFINEAPRVILVGDLREAWEAAQKPEAFTPLVAAKPRGCVASPGPRLSLMPALARVLGIATTGRHHLLLVGPKGTGKSVAVDWFGALQPPLPPGVRLRRALMAEMRSDHSARADFSDAPLVRRVGLQTRAPALTGSLSASSLRPGEFSLAHGGVLIADELPEWSRDAREALREPLERGWVTLSRANGNVELPARFALAATANICPCGGWPATLRETAGKTELPPCRCSAHERDLYRKKLSGPILDRIDIVYPVLQTPNRLGAGAEFLEVHEQAAIARTRAFKRYGVLPGEMDAQELEQRVGRIEAFRKLIERYPTLSLRGRHKIARLTLSIACWDNCSEPTAGNWAEAASYRPEAVGFG